MIIATVRTCPRRWQLYRTLLGNFAALNLGVPLRTFQTAEYSFNSGVNSRLTARAALAYCERHLPDSPSSWALFLEDDVVLMPELKECLPALITLGAEHEIDCWYLCNRKTSIARQFHLAGLVVNELQHPIKGSHALLIPKRNLTRMLDTHWRGTCDHEMFAAIQHPAFKVWQPVQPVLAEHRGEYSTFDPQHRRKLEVNHADSSNTHPPRVEHTDHSLP